MLGRQVAKEVALALGARGPLLGGLGFHVLADVVEARIDVALHGRQTRRFRGAMQRLLEITQLLEMLLEAKVALQRRQQTFRHRIEARFALHGVAGQAKARAHERLGTRHVAGDVVVAATVGDATPQRAPGPVEDHGLGGRRAQVDADVDLQCASPAARVPRCASICR